MKTKHQSKFDETVSILVKAYLNDTLEVGNYCACAIGNLIAAKVGARFVKINSSCYGSRLKWEGVKYEGGEWYRSSDYESVFAGEQQTAIGYDRNHIYLIEKAFESAGRNRLISESENEFAGLMAVVDVLAGIHGIDLKAKESAKAMFVKP